MRLFVMPIAYGCEMMSTTMIIRKMNNTNDNSLCDDSVFSFVSVTLSQHVTMTNPTFLQYISTSKNNRCIERDICSESCVFAF